MCCDGLVSSVSCLQAEMEMDMNSVERAAVEYCHDIDQEVRGAHAPRQDTRRGRMALAWLCVGS